MTASFCPVRFQVTTKILPANKQWFSGLVGQYLWVGVHFALDLLKRVTISAVELSGTISSSKGDSCGVLFSCKSDTSCHLGRSHGLESLCMLCAFLKIWKADSLYTAVGLICCGTALAFADPGLHAVT